MTSIEFTRIVSYHGETIHLTERNYSYLMQCVSNGETIEQAMDRIRIETDEGKQDLETLDYYLS
jgi:hypothetical protein